LLMRRAASRSRPADVGPESVAVDVPICSCKGGDLRCPRGDGRLHVRGAEVGPPAPLARADATPARCAACAGHLDPPEAGAEAGTGGTAERVSCHPFPRPVRHRALLRGRERRRGTTGPRLLP
jgi:hypothetical protein